MRVLVSAASRHGATAEIAETIDRTLRGRGIETEVRPPSDVDDVAGYDAVVLGSAVYMGRWLEEARRLVEEHAALLAARTVWLFSSGPIGDPLKPDEDPVDVADIATSTGGRRAGLARTGWGLPGLDRHRGVGRRDRRRPHVRHGIASLA